MRESESEIETLLIDMSKGCDLTVAAEAGADATPALPEGVRTQGKKTRLRWKS